MPEARRSVKRRKVVAEVFSVSCFQPMLRYGSSAGKPSGCKWGGGRGTFHQLRPGCSGKASRHKRLPRVRPDRTKERLRTFFPWLPPARVERKRLIRAGAPTLFLRSPVAPRGSGSQLADHSRGVVKVKAGHEDRIPTTRLYVLESRPDKGTLDRTSDRIFDLCSRGKAFPFYWRFPFRGCVPLSIGQRNFKRTTIRSLLFDKPSISALTRGAYFGPL